MSGYNALEYIFVLYIYPLELFFFFFFFFLFSFLSCTVASLSFCIMAVSLEIWFLVLFYAL